MLTVLLTAVLAADPSPVVAHPESWSAEKCATATDKIEMVLTDTDVKHLAEIFTKTVCKPVVFSSDVNDVRFSVYIPPQAAGGSAQTAKVLMAAMKAAGLDVIEKEGIVTLSKHVGK